MFNYIFISYYSEYMCLQLPMSKERCTELVWVKPEYNGCWETLPKHLYIFLDT